MAQVTKCFTLARSTRDYVVFETATNSDVIWVYHHRETLGRRYCAEGYAFAYGVESSRLLWRELVANGYKRVQYNADKHLRRGRVA